MADTLHSGGFLGGSPELVASVWDDPESADISDKLKSLLTIAACVQSDRKNVTPEMVHAAWEQGANDLEIHDTVLIAPAFCMYNRYVDGPATWQPRNDAMYRTMGEPLARQNSAWSRRQALWDAANSLALCFRPYGFESNAGS